MGAPASRRAQRLWERVSRPDVPSSPAGPAGRPWPLHGHARSPASPPRPRLPRAPHSARTQRAPQGATPESPEPPRGGSGDRSPDSPRFQRLTCRRARRRRGERTRQRAEIPGETGAAAPGGRPRRRPLEAGRGTRPLRPRPHLGTRRDPRRRAHLGRPAADANVLTRPARDLVSGLSLCGTQTHLGTHDSYTHRNEPTPGNASWRTHGHITKASHWSIHTRRWYHTECR